MSIIELIRMNMTINVLILTDSHLFGARDRELFGMNTFGALKKLSAHLNEGNHKYDLFVATGDLSEDGHPKAYADFHHLTRGLASSTIWMKGNHDRFSEIPDHLGKEYVHKEWHRDPWSLIFLDTSLNGRDEGKLSAGELARLESFLKQHKERHVMVYMHHQPVEVGAEFIDILGLQNKQEFWEITSPYKNIRSIIFGHVHQEYDKKVNGIQLLATPSTAMQFKPFSRELDFDLPTHGYRTLTLNEDGSIETNIFRIDP